ncbi:MAG: heparinase II/III family protein [Desulfovibrionales bacterium]
MNHIVSEFWKYVHTIRYLKPKQIGYRLFYTLRERYGRKRKQGIRQTGVEAQWKPVRFAVEPLRYPWIDARGVERNEFTFLNETIDFGRRVDWEVPEVGRLWRYNLHYFQYLFPEENLSREKSLDLMHHWVAGTPPGTPDAWDPYPISLRLVNWIKFLSLTPETTPGEYHLPAGSAYLQTQWLVRSLEYHLLGNHLFRNAKALIFSGMFFQGEEAKDWLHRGLRILDRELEEQILPDGGHFERSPMYHAMILEDVLDLLNLSRASDTVQIRRLEDRLRSKAGQMMTWLLGMTHPDGQIALFNDAAFKIEPEPKSLGDYYRSVTGEKPVPPRGLLWAFEKSGYYVLSPSNADRMIVDCGPVGPDYQPGHAHSDTLSFELSLRWQRIIVDSGCCRYDHSELRQYNRGNQGHNTLTIDGLNQTEVWGAHRTARRARPMDVRLFMRDRAPSFTGAHDGYTRLPGKPVHRRTVTWEMNTITIQDTVEGEGEHTIDLRLHIHPEVEVIIERSKALLTREGVPVATIAAIGLVGVTLVQGRYCPEFVKQLDCPVLAAAYGKRALPFECGWKITIVNSD